MNITAAADAIRLDSVTKSYGKGDSSVKALDGVSIGFARGGFTAVMGPSGSGKSTFLHCAAGLDKPTSGSVTLDGQDITGLNETALTKLRRDQVGFIFPSFNLLPALTVEQNVTLPLLLAGRKPNKRDVLKVLDRVGLRNRRRHLPSQLSGGQQQRVAIARALVSQPEVIFADEPTAALDSRTAAEVLELLRESVVAGGQTVVMVTNDPIAAAYADRVVFLVDGRIAGELYAPTAEAVAERLTHFGAWAGQRSLVAA